MSKKEQDRGRVVGTGPGRQKLKMFHKLGEVSPECLEELQYIITKDDYSDIDQPTYPITKTLDYVNTHGVSGDVYRQVLLQRASPENLAKDPTQDEYIYDQWMTDVFKLDNTMSEFDKYFNNVYRVRISELQPHKEIIWHIDTNTSVACRGQICINKNDSVFEFKDRKGLYQLRMKPGEFWFINTGWPHRVVAGDDLRHVVVFTFHFDNVKNKSDLVINNI